MQAKHTHQRRMHSQTRKKSTGLMQQLQNKQVVMVIAAVLVLLLLLGFKAFILFIIIAAAAAVLNYFIHVSNIHLHLGHVSFLAVIFSYTLGFKYGIFMVLIAHVLAEVLAGHADVEMIITGAVYIVNCLIASLLTGVPIVTLGLGLAVFQAIATMVLGMGAGTPIAELITEDGVEFAMLILYYLTLARPLVALIA
ncbi:hypothetical protein QT06_C0001G0250 [archaeon GW2011_AR15]|nr:hypothetical protein QT06_C0001G0250 [archaeon GW2011_AR15]